MDRLHFIDIKPSIDRSETASIKDAIFQRARQKAQDLANEKSENYTSDIKNDVMSIARESITASEINPFNQFMENIGIHNEQSIKSKENLTQDANKSAAFDSLNNAGETKQTDVNIKNESFVKSIREETMAEARNKFRTNLNATLNFLNTQAAIQAAKHAHSKINSV